MIVASICRGYFGGARHVENACGAGRHLHALDDCPAASRRRYAALGEWNKRWRSNPASVREDAAAFLSTLLLLLSPQLSSARLLRPLLAMVLVLMKKHAGGGAFFFSFFFLVFPPAVTW